MANTDATTRTTAQQIVDEIGDDAGTISLHKALKAHKHTRQDRRDGTKSVLTFEDGSKLRTTAGSTLFRNRLEVV